MYIYIYIYINFNSFPKFSFSFLDGDHSAKLKRDDPSSAAAASLFHSHMYPHHHTTANLSVAAAHTMAPFPFSHQATHMTAGATAGAYGTGAYPGYPGTAMHPAAGHATHAHFNTVTGDSRVMPSQVRILKIYKDFFLVEF